MTAFDYTVVAIFALSLMLGVWRGVISEVLSLLAWVVAFVMGRMWSPRLASELGPWLSEPVLRYVAAFAGIVVVVLLLFVVLRVLLSGLLRVAGLSLVDRFLGAIFGFLRGLLIVLAAVMTGGLTTLPKQSWWRDAMLSPPLETMVVAMKPWLPPDWAGKIKYR